MVYFETLEGAKCTELPLEVVDKLFFQEEDLEAIPKAKAICASCPLVETCLVEALKPNKQTQLSTTGIWGGSTTEERAIIRRNKPKLITLHITKLMDEYGEPSNNE